MGNALQSLTDPHPIRLLRAIPVLALVVALAGACGGSEAAPSTESVEVDTVAGVVRVSNNGSGLWTEEERWSFGLARVRIGELDGAEEYVMGRVADVAVGPSGRVYVAESQAKEVRVYSPDGRYLFRFGREGEGPGEFAYLDALQVTPRGEIFVRDPQLSRVSFFDLQGDFLRQFRLERPFNNRAGLIVYDSVGTVLDTVDAARWRSRNIAVYQGDRPRGSFTAPFSLVGAAAVDPEGRVLSGVGDAYRLTLQTLAGDTLAVFTRELEARPLSADDVDLVEIGDGWAAGIRTDELDVSYAVVLPLVKPGGAP